MSGKEKEKEISICHRDWTRNRNTLKVNEYTIRYDTIRYDIEAGFFFYYKTFLLLLLLLYTIYIKIKGETFIIIIYKNYCWF